MKVFTHVIGRALEDIPAGVQRAEALGFDGVNFGETSQDSFLACTLAAASSKRLLVGTGVAIAFPRSPMITAYASWNIQQFSKGRFELGLGTQVKGHNERRFSVPWTAPGPRMREYVQSLRAIWDCWQNGKKLDYQGQHYSFTLMTPEFSPPSIPYRQVPVYIAAVNPYLARLAGELCDGILLHSFTSLKYIQEVTLPNVEAGAKKAGRSLKDVEIIGGGFIATGPTEADVLRELEVARRRISFYASTRTYKPVLDVHGWGDTCLKLHELSLQGKWNEMPKLITDKMLETFCVTGTYDTIAAKVKAQHKGWAQRISVPTPPKDQGADQKVQAVVREIQKA